MSEPINLVSLGLRFADSDRQVLLSAGFKLSEYLQPGDLESGIKAAAAAEAVCLSNTWMRHLGRDFVSKLERCRLVVTGGSAELLDLDEASFRAISVANCPRYSAPAVAEHAFTILLALARRLQHRGERPAVQDMASHDEMIRNWRGFELRGKTLGLMGYGAVGQALIPIAKGFGMNVVVARRDLPRLFTRLFLDRKITFVKFSDMLPQSDVIISSLPGGIKTRGFFGVDTFLNMRKGAIFVNVGRPHTVDEAELKAALERGDLAGAALDSVTPEGGAALRQLKNVFITPGMGWNTVESAERLSEECALNVTAFFSGHPQNLVLDARTPAGRS
jgi:phosphoglycerate dehydrogenase-like enzyme